MLNENLSTSLETDEDGKVTIGECPYITSINSEVRQKGDI